MSYARYVEAKGHKDNIMYRDGWQTISKLAQDIRIERSKNSIDVVTSLCRYLKQQSDFEVFAYEKIKTIRGDYIAVNTSISNYGKWADK